MEKAVGDEAGLWSRALTGDGEAFGRLFDAHRDRVYRLARRFAETSHDAEDVTAAAFLELWRRRRDVRLVDGSVLPWLLVTTTNVGRNARRAARRYRHLLARLPRERGESEAADVGVEHGVLGLDAELTLALRALRGPDLHLMVLVALEDYPLADAAAVLGLTAGAAKTRLHRARARLRERLGDHPTFSIDPVRGAGS